MNKLLFLTLSLTAISQLNAAQVSELKSKGTWYLQPSRSSSNSCKNNSGNLQSLSIGQFNISFCSNNSPERSEALQELQNELQKELGAQPKAK